MIRFAPALGCISVCVLANGTVRAQSQAGAEGTAGDRDALSEITVTANKRTQSINDVALSITAVSGTELVDRGIASTADLAQVVPGLTAEPSPFNTPVYTLRGVGFYDSTLSASPTVAVYTDEVPLPFSAMTKAAALDLERVEVLKGPQGTLFGENTTGGAINFIAAKPTDQFAAGFDGSYGRFNSADFQGYVSGPLSGDLKARFSARLIEGGDWQYSATRNDTLGATNVLQMRLLLDWTPSDRLTVSVNLNGWTDNSDAQAPQRIATFLSVPTNPQAPANAAFPYPARNDRAADWTYDIPPLKHDDYFMQAALRADYKVTDAVTLTSITAPERYKTDAYDDFDGTSRNIADNHTQGYINTISQELRLTGVEDRLNWVAGANYEFDKTHDKLYYFFGDSTTSQVGPLHMTYTSNFSDQDVKNAAAFGNAEFEVVPNLKVQAGVRYTDSRRSFSGCTSDIAGGGVAQVFELLETLARSPALPFVPIPPNGCATLDTTFAPIVSPLKQELDEKNTSWRGGLNYKTPNDGLVYATVSKGYKGGSYPTTSASTVTQYEPVKQESVLAYETGFKQPVLQHRVQVNGALFYYDYKDKQLSGRVLDPVFGPLTALVQIPKSRVYGAEAEFNARPMQGLTFDVAATYLKTKIQQFTGYDNAGVLQNYAGSRFPYSPELQVVATGQYEWDAYQGYKAFVAADIDHNSATNASIGNTQDLAIDAYTVLDLRAGIKTADGHWRFQLWGRNVTNKYYWTNALQSEDVYVRYTGMPATFGVSANYKY